MNSLFETTDFTIFDVETTGLDPRKGDRIVEIAGVRIRQGAVATDAAFSQFVNPGRDISSDAQVVNRISPEDLEGASPIEEILPSFIEFASDSILIAHNAEFDMSFLEAEKEGCWGYIDLPEALCSRNLSRAVFPKEYRHDLDTVLARLGIEQERSGRHRALPDVLMTAQAFLKMVERGEITSLKDLRQKAGIGVSV